MDKRFEAKILSWMPRLPGVLKRFAKEARRFDSKHPAKALARVKGIVEKVALNSAVDESQVMGDLRQMFAAPSMQQELRRLLQYLPRAAKKEASANPSYSLLLKLISKADEQVPLISLAALFNAADPTNNLRPQCEPLDLIELAENSKGEARAKAVIRAYLEVAEWLYKPYLRRLWLLSCVITNDWRVRPQHFGNLVLQLERRLADYPGLVEGNVGWRRNAAAHGHWEYVKAEDALVLWDKNRPQEKVPVKDLLAQLNGMYQISGPTFTLVAQLYFFRDFMWNTGLAEALIVRIPRFLSSDEARRSAAEQEILKKAMKVFTPLENYITANNQVLVVATS
jgi:hypothetical protein